LLVRSMVDYLLEKKRADRVIMDPQRTNSRAIRCYEKCGFKKVRILPKHEFHEGELRDCWLIEFNRSI
ncbi:GNAT family N-acetyltransferase, partial [Marinovum sp. 1_MG-2023]